MAGELRATILSTLKGDAAEKLAKQLDGVSGRMEKFGSIAGKAVKGVASLGAALVSSKFIGDSIEQAKNLERSVLALDSVFGNVAPRMVEFSKNAAEMGLSQSEASKASTFLGSVLQQYGFSATEAATETEKLTKLSADLAATYGYDVQEALLAVTALFRGEYDPIEKFGVAMKQNEINAVRTARGLGDLTGAAEMQADAQIRLELLMQRSASAQGAMERGAGTLYVETEKLRATFENLQANLGQELIPVFAELFEKLRPIIEDSGPGLIVIFEYVSEAIQHLADILVDLFDPTTELGEEFMRLGNAFDSLFETIFGRDFNLEAVFDGARWALDLFIRMLHDLILIVENVIISFQALGIYIEAIFNRDFDTLKKGIGGIAEELYSARDAALETAAEMDVLYYKAARSLDELGDQTEVWDAIGKNAAAAGTIAGNQFGKAVGKGLKVEKDAIADFWGGLYEEIEKQSARLRLEALGASEGLIGAILGAGQDWQKVFDSIVSGGLKAVQKAQTIFNQTANGIKEIEEAAKQAKAQLDKLRDAEVQRARQSASSNQQAATYYNTYANMLDAGFEKEVAMQVAREEYAMEIDMRIHQQIQAQKELADTFSKSANDIFSAFSNSGVVEELGVYQTAVRDLRGELVGLIEETQSGDGQRLFGGQTATELVESVTQVTNLMEVVSRERDKMVTGIEEMQDRLQGQIGDRQSLFEGVYNSIIGNVNITAIGGKTSTIIKSLTKTLAQTRNFADQITQLRSMGVAGSFIDQIINAGAVTGGATAKALIAGGPKAISEINRLYAQIDGVAMEIGTQAADSMYSAGISTTQGLLNGLLSQQSELEMVANQLGTAFKEAFDNAMTGGMITYESPGYDAILQGLSASGALGQAMGGSGAIQGGGGSGVFNITVNAGMGANGQSIGQIIVDEIKRFERQSGKVFISA